MRIDSPFSKYCGYVKPDVSKQEPNPSSKSSKHPSNPVSSLSSKNPLPSANPASGISSVFKSPSPL